MGFEHDALLYDSPDELAAVAGPFLLAGLAAGEAAVIAVSQENTELLRDAVGNDPRVVVLERHTLYRSRTPTAITTFGKVPAEYATPGARARVVGEVDFGTTVADWREWQRYESVVNHAFAELPMTGLCVFDTQRLPQPLLDTAVHTHPHLRSRTGRQSNPDFVDPGRYVTALPVPEEPLESTTPALAVQAVSDFIGLRHTVRDRLAGVDGPEDLIEDFLLAVDEMASNAVRHGRPPVDLRLWTGPGTLVCTIRDSGPGWDDPFAGYGPAHGQDLSHGGMGLWLARQLCDHVTIRRGSDSNSVRLTSHWS